MQQEIDGYENEIKDLKKKIPKKLPFAALPANEALQRSLSRDSQSNAPAVNQNQNNFGDTSLFSQEIKLVKTMNKMLEKNNSELKSNLSEALLTKLPPFPKLPKDLNTNFVKNESISRLTKQSDNLMKVII